MRSYNWFRKVNNYTIPFTSTTIKNLLFGDISNISILLLDSIGNVCDVPRFKSRHNILFPIGEKRIFESSFEKLLFLYY